MNEPLDFELTKFQNKNTELVQLQDELPIDDSKLSTQTLINIKGINIYFPYKPYEIQIDYMNKVIESLNNNNIAALESPTGTGKTLCLLCASLAWMKYMREVRKIKIKMFYTSRTHSQISNVIKELKKTVYLPITSILSSRDKSCINVSYRNYSKNPSSLNTICKKNKKKCLYYNNVKKIPILSLNLIDLEELCELGKSSLFCPFHFEGDKTNKSDITFLPYNYIVDKEIKDTLKISLENSILVIDEAHNIEKVLEESCSVELITYYFENMIKEMEYIINEKKSLKNKHFADFPEQNIREEMDIIMNIKENIEKVSDVLQGDCYPRKGKVLEIKEFFDLFMNCNNRNLNKNIITIDEIYGKENNSFPKKQGITPNNIHKHYNFLYYLKEEYLEIYDEESVLTPYVRALELIKHLYFNQEDLKSFIFYISDDEKEIMNKIIKTRILKLLCFDPGFGFNKIIKEKPHNIILTSGTLSPIDGLEFSLKTPIPIQLENKHIIDKSHSKFEIIKSEKLNNSIIKYQFDYSNRSNLNMIKSLGNIILNYVKSLNKGGILVFFPSFNFLSQCYSIWVSDKIIEKISKIKKVYYDNKMNKNLIHDFMINKEKNSIIFSVVRGNISEGLDFKDDFARIVICVGIPYANFYEERIQLKMKFLDGFFNQNQNLKINKMSGRDWYKIDAIQTVNQSLGRVLRHKDDYGMMICIDLRFEYQYIFKLFSKWMKDICDIISIDNMNYFSNIKKYFDKLEIENRNDIKKKVIEYESESVKKEKFLEYFNMNNNKKNKKDSIDNKLDFFIKGDFNLNNNINDNLGLNNKKIGKKKNVNLNKTNNLNYENIEMNNIKDGKIKNSNLNNKDIIPFINYKDLNIEKNKKRKAPYIYNEKSTIENLVKKKGVDEIMHSNISVTKMDFSKISTPKKLSSEKTKFTSISKEMCESNTEIKENISLNLINYTLDNSYNDFLQNFISNRENNSKTLKNLEINTEEELKKINKNENNNEIVNIKEEILNNNTNFIEINDDFNCPICLKNVKENPEIVFSISKCKHIICEECWTKCLEIKMECPICKKKVREKTLKKILRK